MTDKDKGYWESSLTKMEKNLDILDADIEINDWADVKKEQLKIRAELEKRISKIK